MLEMQMDGIHPSKPIEWSSPPTCQYTPPPNTRHPAISETNTLCLLGRVHVAFCFSSNNLAVTLIMYICATQYRLLIDVCHKARSGGGSLSKVRSWGGSLSKVRSGGGSLSNVRRGGGFPSKVRRGGGFPSKGRRGGGCPSKVR